MDEPTNAQADGAWDPSRFKSHAEEIAAMMEQKAKSDICWDCGTEFVPTTPTQRECVRCYVQGKL